MKTASLGKVYDAADVKVKGARLKQIKLCTYDNASLKNKPKQNHTPVTIMLKGDRTAVFSNAD